MLASNNEKLEFGKLISKQLEIAKRLNSYRSNDIGTSHKTKKKADQLIDCESRGPKISDSNCDCQRICSKSAVNVSKSCGDVGNQRILRELLIPRIICKKLKYRKCHHYGKIIVDRDILKRKQHCKILATPKKFILPPPCRLIFKKLLPATNRVAELAYPKRLYVFNNFEEHFSHLKVFQIENFLESLYQTSRFSPEQVLKLRKQEIRDEKMRQRFKKKKLREMKRKVMREKMKIVDGMMDSCFGRYRDFLLSCQKVKVQGEMALISDVILLQICSLMKQKVPSRETQDIIEKFFCDFADKISFWMTSFVEQSHYKTISRDENGLIVKSLLKGILENVRSDYGIGDGSMFECYMGSLEKLRASGKSKKSEYDDDSSVEIVSDSASVITISSDSDECEYTSDSGSEFDIDKEGLECDQLLDAVNLYKVQNEEFKRVSEKARASAKQGRQEEKERLAEEAKQKKIAMMKAKAARRKKKGKQKPKGKWEVDFQQCGKPCS